MTTPTPQPGILSITPYVPGKSAERKDVRLIKLSSNENPYGPSPSALAAYGGAAKKLGRYPDGGAHALVAAIAKVHGIEAERIVCGAGSDEIIGLLVHAYAGPGDEVLYSQHGFLMYKIYALGAGATPVTAPEKNLHADVDALIAAVTPRTKLVFLANPNNPTGTLLPESELKRLRAGLREDIILAIDGAYAEYLKDGDALSGKNIVKDSTNVVMLRTFSKIYGLPSLRLGWMYGPKQVCDVLHRVRGPFNTSGAGQTAGVAAMEDQAYVAEQRRLNTEQRDVVGDALEKLGFTVVPSAGNFVLVHVGSAEAASRIVSGLAEAGIFVRDVVAYGLPEHIRISIGTAEENQLMLAALTKLHHG